MAAKATWLMRDGTEVAIRDMGDGHLRNTALMLLRRASVLHLNEALRMAQRADFCNGDMALMAVDEEIEAFQSVAPVAFVKERWAPIFNACRRRGIKLEG